MNKRDHRAGPPSPLALLGDFLLLSCALAGFFFSFLSLYGLQSNQNLPVISSFGMVPAYRASHLIPLLLLLIPIALFIWSVPRFGWTLAGAAGIAVLFYAVYSGDAVLQGGQLILKQIINQFSDRVGLISPMTLELSLTFPQQTGAITGFLAVLLAVYALALGWAIVRARRWWLVLALTLPPLLPGLLADVYPHWLSFMALTACWCSMLLSSLCKWAAPSGRGRLTLVTLPAVGVLLALLTALLPMEGYTRPQWALTAEAILTEWGHKVLSPFSQLEGPFSSSGDSTQSVDLSRAGPRYYTGRTMLTVHSDYTGPVYLRNMSTATYTGTSWEPLALQVYQTDYVTPVQRLMASASSQYPAPDPEDFSVRSPLLFPAALNGSETNFSITVEHVGVSGHSAYVPYYPLGFSENCPANGDAYFSVPEQEDSYTIFFQPNLDGLRYSYLDLDTNTYQSLVERAYLTVPDELIPVLGQFARQGALEAADPAELNSYRRIDTAQAVADLLAEHCDYNLRAPRTPEGEDFVSYFLTESRRGYCMHFASAATLLLRYLGVPARYVSGFTAQLEADQTVKVPDSAAHAWVEIYLDDFGWYPVEVTPPDASDPESSAPPATSSLPPSLPPETSRPPEVSALPSAAPTQTPTAPGGNDGSSGGRAILLSTLLAVLLSLSAAVLWLGQRLPKQHRAKRLSQVDPNAAVIYAYRCLMGLKKWGGTIPSAAAELAEKACFSQHTLTGEERRAMLSLLAGEHRRLYARLPMVKRLPFRYLWGSAPFHASGHGEG